MTKRRYELLAGTHYEVNPKYQDSTPLDVRHAPDRLIKYTHPAIIESERKLDEIYPNKFKEVIDRPTPHIVTEERKQAVTDLLSQGKWGEGDRSFLESLTDDGFARILRQAGVEQSIPPNPPSPPPDAPAKTRSHLGVDVTDDFQIAYDHGFKVFRNPAGKHQVVKGKGKPLNPHALDAEEVDTFVQDYMKSG